MEQDTENLPVVKEINPHYIYNQQTLKYDVLDLNTGKWVDSVNKEPMSMIYNLQMADTICDHIRDGRTLKEICQQKDMPTATRFYAWLALYPELRVRYEQARKQRADHFHDRALEIALSLPNKDMVPGCKLAVDTLKWAAEKASPDYYGKKEEKASGGTAINITLHTGVLDSQAPKDIIVDEFGNFKGFDDGTFRAEDSEVSITETNTAPSKDRWGVEERREVGTEEGTEEREGVEDGEQG